MTQGLFNTMKGLNSRLTSSLGSLGLFTSERLYSLGNLNNPVLFKHGEIRNRYNIENVNPNAFKSRYNEMITKSMLA